MSKISDFGKKLLFWSYGRSTWQYDVLCVLILAFIFLTPPSWFENSERAHWATHQNASNVAPQRLFIDSFDTVDSPGTSGLVRRVQELTGRTNARVKAVRPVMNNEGRIIAYEVDIE